MRLIRMVGIVLLFFSLNSYSLVPVEGLVMGQAEASYQSDPLAYIFSDIYDTSKKGENKKIKLYSQTFQDGLYLNESCQYYSSVPKFSTSWMEEQAKRSVAATLQYIGIDSSVKAIGRYGHDLKISEDDFKKLSSNLIKNYCSKNITVFSLKQIEKSLFHYYKNPASIVPTISSSPFAPAKWKISSESEEARSKEFDFAIKNFRSFCSWGGDVSDYRMLPPYLSNSFIMSFIIKNMIGAQNNFDEQSEKINRVSDPDTVQVMCTDLICRKTTQLNFKTIFPKTIGSTGTETDLVKLYCHHFRFQGYEPKKTLPEVAAWIKQDELETPVLETNYFISLMTGVPDLFFSANNYEEMPLLVKSSVNERWDHWAENILRTFSKDLYYEESLKVKTRPKRDRIALRTEGFGLDFSVTLGEMDRVIEENDKLSLSFDLKISKNYLQHIRSKWKHLSDEIDVDGKNSFKKEIANYIEIQLKTKENLFHQKMWNQDFSQLIADELLAQAITYKGPLFDSYKDQILTVPVKFSYGIFALSYIRYRADVTAGRLKLNL